MMNDVFKVAAVAAVMTVAGVPDAAGAVTADGAGSRAAAADTAANVLHEVVVTGSGRQVPQRLLPYTVSVVGERQLEATGHTQVLSAISGMVPSLFVTQRSVFGFGVSGGGSGHIKLRGVGGVTLRRVC